MNDVMREMIKSGDVKSIRAAIASGFDVNKCVYKDPTPLMWAIYYKQPEIAKLFISNGADVHKTDIKNSNAFLWAAEKGYIEILDICLEKGVDLEVKDNPGQTAIFYASRGGQVETVEYLIAKGIDIHTIDRQTSSNALFGAVGNGHIDVVRVLLKNGINAERRNDIPFTPRSYAKNKGHTEIVELIDIYIENNKQATPENLAMLTPNEIKTPENRVLLSFVHKKGMLVKLFEMSTYPQQEAVLSTLKGQILKDKALMTQIIPIMQKSHKEHHEALKIAGTLKYHSNVNHIGA